MLSVRRSLVGQDLVFLAILRRVLRLDRAVGDLVAGDDPDPVGAVEPPADLDLALVHDVDGDGLQLADNCEQMNQNVNELNEG